METPLQGEVFYLYAFDVADEIRTEKMEKSLAKRAVPLGPSNERLVPKDLPFYQPLIIDANRESWRIEGKQVRTLVRIYDVGVVSVMISVPFEAKSLKELIRFHRPILDGQGPLDKAAHELCRGVVENLRPYLVRGAPEVDIPEAYTVFVFHGIEGVSNVEGWVTQQRREIAGLLAETDPERLSQQQIDETFRHCLSFEYDEVAIVDWDAALLVNLSGETEDEIHVLELANLQLEELVLMDKRLDAFLNRAYDELERNRPKLWRWKRGEIEKLRRFRMDVAKITDEVSNISKFFGDFYFARIYLAARERFHLATWRESVQNRLLHLDSLYETFRSENNEAKMLLLEAMIVLLFIIDLIGVFWLGR